MKSASTWATSQGYEVVGTSQDRNVSGGTSPFERDGLGPWLNKPELLARYDVLVASSVDRLGRSAADLFKLREWAEEQGQCSSDTLAAPVVAPRIRRHSGSDCVGRSRQSR